MKFDIHKGKFGQKIKAKSLEVLEEKTILHQGKASMVDVSAKAPTTRQATAQGHILLGKRQNLISARINVYSFYLNVHVVFFPN